MSYASTGYIGALPGSSSRGGDRTDVRSPTRTEVRSPTRTEVRSPTSTSTEVRSPTSTSTEVRSPTSTSTEAYTQGNFTSTVTGGAGAGATHVTINLPGYPPPAKRQAVLTTPPPNGIFDHISDSRPPRTGVFDHIAAPRPPRPFSGLGNSVDLPHGVTSPVVAHVHPYPTRFHGGIWTRPVFGYPWVRSPHFVLRPSHLDGLGDANDWDTGVGVFRRPRYDGGGLFNSVSGLGAIPGDVGKFVVAGIVGFALTAYLMKR